MDAGPCDALSRSMPMTKKDCQVSILSFPGYVGYEKTLITCLRSWSETAATKPTFRKPLREHHCLILADGFYEWKQEGSRKQPHYITLKSEDAFAFAGLWDRWQPPDGEPLETCTILTTTPNEVLQRIRDRMPVILPPDAYTVWLDPAVRDGSPSRLS